MRTQWEIAYLAAAAIASIGIGAVGLALADPRLAEPKWFGWLLLCFLTGCLGFAIYQLMRGEM